MTKKIRWQGQTFRKTAGMSSSLGVVGFNLYLPLELIKVFVSAVRRGIMYYEQIGPERGLRLQL